MLNRSSLLVLLLLAVGCVSTPETPTAVPPPTLPIATGIPVTSPKSTHAGQNAAPTMTVAALPTPEDVAALFDEASAQFNTYQPPETDPQALYDALAGGAIQFLHATANGDVSLEGQPALAQLQEALTQLPNLPPNAQPQVLAIHTGDDQGGSRDLAFVAMQGVMGLPIIGIVRLGASYQALPPVTFDAVATPDSRNFYPGQVEARDITGDGIPELIYTIEYPGGSGTTNQVTAARWIPDENRLRTIFHAALINWAGESDYQITSAADASTIQLTFPWFGAFDHKLLAHPKATQTWEYDDAQDRFVRVSQTIEAAKTPRQQLNAAEYAFRNGDWGGALELYQRAWSDQALQAEDFGDSKADPKAFAKFRQAVVLGLLGRDADARKLLNDAQRGGDALALVANTYARNAAGKDGALRGWIAMANAGDLYQLIYESKAGNLDFPFEASEIYLQGGIVVAYLNTHPDADQDPKAVWRALASLGFKPSSRAAADLDADGTNEFLFVTQEGGKSPNQGQSLWFVYQRDKVWRVRGLDFAERLTVNSQARPLPNGKGSALQYDSSGALTWDGTRVVWLDAQTLEPRIESVWTRVGGGVLEDDF